MSALMYRPSFSWAMKYIMLLPRLNRGRTDHLPLPSQHALRPPIDYTHPLIIGPLSGAPSFGKIIK